MGRRALTGSVPHSLSATQLNQAGRSTNSIQSDRAEHGSGQLCDYGSTYCDGNSDDESKCHAEICINRKETISNFFLWAKANATAYNRVAEEDFSARKNEKYALPKHIRRQNESSCYNNKFAHHGNKSGTIIKQKGHKSKNGKITPRAEPERLQCGSGNRLFQGECRT